MVEGGIKWINVQVVWTTHRIVPVLWHHQQQQQQPQQQQPQQQQHTIYYHNTSRYLIYVR